MTNTKAFSIASMDIEPLAAVAVDLQQPLGEFRVERVTLCSRESGGTGLKIVSCFKEQIL